jgi:type IV pilus assembly protein PilY1
LADPAYEHIYFNDLQPRIFDARIYPDKGPNDPTNPNGWATVMVCGMRFGGGKIAADIDKKDGAYNADVDKAMSSAYAILDITNPEEPPKLLAEITFPELGFTTCHPGVIPMRDFDADHKEGTNQWYLIFGSGPTSKDASNVDGANTVALIDGTSSQQAVMYAVDLVELAQNRKVVTLTSAGKKPYTAVTAADPYYLVRFSETESMVSKPIAVDWNLDFNTDAAYFGISYGNHTSGWNGKMRRLVMENGSNPTVPTNWTLNSTLLDLTDGVSTNLDNGQPIVASATAGTDKAGNRWLFFGTGRFYSQTDKLNQDQQSYYGVKEPFTVVNDTKEFNYNPVPFNNLMDVTSIKVYENGTTLSGFAGGFQDLVNHIEDQKQGWRLEFDFKPGDRNLGEAVLAGDVLTFTTYVPSDDPCIIAGESQVYALYYRTGTAYPTSIIGLDYSDKSGDDPLVLKRIGLGTGMTITPNIHVGREQGSRAYIQTSSGAIKELEQENPGVVKSGKMPMKPGEQTCP